MAFATSVWHESRDGAALHFRDQPFEMRDHRLGAGGRSFRFAARKVERASATAEIRQATEIAVWRLLVRCALDPRHDMRRGLPKHRRRGWR